MLEKQIIHIDSFQKVDERTIEALKRGERYKLFKLDFEVDYFDKNRLEILYRILDEIPELEIFKICSSCRLNQFINELAEKSNFKTKQDFFKVLDFKNYGHTDPPGQSEPYEYLNKVLYPEDHDMS